MAQMATWLFCQSGYMYRMVDASISDPNMHPFTHITTSSHYQPITDSSLSRARADTISLLITFLKERGYI